MSDENKKGKNKGEEATLEMTPMIDVVFQLLIFFIVTLNQPDILSQFDALRPAAQESREVQDPPASITIKGFPSHPGLGAYFFGNDQNRRTVTLDQLRGVASQMAKVNRNQNVVVNCTDTAPHGCLVRVLDLLSDAGLRSVSVFSLDNGSGKPW
ncbi:MAG: biopolymer transporter ExbD [Kiritimatiellae bacterium]|nr:biopolymer transporter ExbD [Kiritimatiellia bacterium]